MSKETSAALEELLKVVGKNAEAQSVTEFINTGFPPLNYALSGRMDGGLPFGRMIEMFGESSTGKTALATDWMIAAQKMGGAAMFIDWERSFDVGMAESQGLNSEMPFWIYRRPRTWEEGNIDATKSCKVLREMKAIPPEAPILVVFDSIASAIPQSSSGKTIDELTMNDTSALARVTSTTLKHQAQYCADYNATFLYLNQVREKINVTYGDKTGTPGGKAMEFYATCRMQLKRSQVREDDKEKTVVGQDITIDVRKSKLTAPFKKATLRLSFDDETGMATFNKGYSLVEFMVANGHIPLKGSWVEWAGKKYQKAHFIKAVIEGEVPYADLVNAVTKAIEA